MDPITIEAIRTALTLDTSAEDRLAAVVAALGAFPSAATAESESARPSEPAPKTAPAPSEPAPPAAAATPLPAPAMPPLPPRLTIEQALDLMIAKLRAALPDESAATASATPKPATVAAARQGMRIVMVPSPARPAPSRPAPRHPLPTLPRTAAAPRTPPRRSKP